MMGGDGATSRAGGPRPDNKANQAWTWEQGTELTGSKQHPL